MLENQNNKIVEIIFLANKSMYEFWRKKITEYVNQLEGKTILNLASKEYSHVILTDQLHKKWINKKANYDLFLLPYEKFIAKTEKNCTLFPLMPGQKWPAISKFIRENIDLVTNYDFIMLPDDDLLITVLKLHTLS